jgi:hypothetical protein
MPALPSRLSTESPSRPAICIGRAASASPHASGKAPRVDQDAASAPHVAHTPDHSNPKRLASPRGTLRFPARKAVSSVLPSANPSSILRASVLCCKGTACLLSVLEPRKEAAGASVGVLSIYERDRSLGAGRICMHMPYVHYIDAIFMSICLYVWTAWRHGMGVYEYRYRYIHRLRGNET